MGSDIGKIQSLRAVDAWIDVINANINGGVRTAFKASRLRFGGSNTQLDRPATASTLPLQFPEPSLITSNTVVDFTQGAITSSTEVSHLAIQGEGFFVLMREDVIDHDPLSGSFAGFKPGTSSAGVMILTRDGEFHTDSAGLLRASNGYLLCVATMYNNPFGLIPPKVLVGGCAVFNDLENTATTVNLKKAIPLSNFLDNGTILDGNGGPPAALVGSAGASSLAKVTLGKQNLTYTPYGSTMFAYNYDSDWNTYYTLKADVTTELATSNDATILAKSLEASNSSMTQSVPELSLAQKLFSALTKILQTTQSNVDAVLNTIR